LDHDEGAHTNEIGMVSSFQTPFVAPKIVASVTIACFVMTTMYVKLNGAQHKQRYTKFGRGCIGAMAAHLLPEIRGR
jgi:hypothetical protein